MKFGEIKSKIENQLTESYKKNLFKDNFFIFEELVLKNKNISKLFFLYDELSTKKGLSENMAVEFVNESIIAYENLINKIQPVHLRELKAWVGHNKCENNYENIDNLFSTNVLTLENKIKSKNLILEELTQKKNIDNEIINVPLQSMVSVANKTIKSYLKTLGESERQEIYNLYKKPKKKLFEDYKKIKNVVLEKLEKQKEFSDEETSLKIEEVLDKIKNEKIDQVNFFKLKKLSENL